MGRHYSGRPGAKGPTDADVLPTPERRNHGPVERLERPIGDNSGRPARPYRAIDTLAVMERRGSITAAMRQAGENFRARFMTAQLDRVVTELSDVAARRIEAGEWPWSFFCYPEDRPRPVFPSSFFLLAPGDGSLGLAVRCPACQRTSVNLVSHEHVDLPFHNDPKVGVVEHVFNDDVAGALEEFRAELYSASFDTRRLAL